MSCILGRVLVARRREARRSLEEGVSRRTRRAVQREHLGGSTLVYVCLKICMPAGKEDWEPGAGRASGVASMVTALLTLAATDVRI